MLTFNTIDVETANADRASICQIGLVQVRDGEVVSEWSTLVNPEGQFHWRNVLVHGIEAKDVRGQPTLSDLREDLHRQVDGSVVVSHTSFDQAALDAGMHRYGLNRLAVTWLDSAQIVRQTWPNRYGRKGYGLKNVATDLGISFRHHDALEDARATAKVVLRACQESGKDIVAWIQPDAYPARIGIPAVRDAR